MTRSTLCILAVAFATACAQTQAGPSADLALPAGCRPGQLATWTEAGLGRTDVPDTAQGVAGPPGPSGETLPLPASCVVGTVIVADGAGGVTCVSFAQAFEDATGFELDGVLTDDDLDVAAVVTTLGTQTLTIPGQYPTVTAALASLANRRIAPGALVTLQVASGTLDEPGTISVEHPDGARIALVGGGAGSTTLRFADTTGILCGRNAALGEISGLTLAGPGAGGGADGDGGIVAQDGCALRLGADVRVRSFPGAGLVARRGARISGLGATVEDVGGVGVEAYDAALINQPGLDVSRTGSHGIAARRGAVVVADAATVTDAGAFGVYAEAGAVMQAADLVVSDADATGAYVTGGSYASIPRATIEWSSRPANGTWGLRADLGSVAQASQATIAGVPGGVASSNQALVTLQGTNGATRASIQVAGDGVAMSADQRGTVLADWVRASGPVGNASAYHLFADADGGAYIWAPNAEFDPPNVLAFQARARRNSTVYLGWSGSTPTTVPTLNSRGPAASVSNWSIE